MGIFLTYKNIYAMLLFMKNQTLPYIEDYLEILGGYVLSNPRIQTPVIRLARYDVQIVDSMASQTSKGIALTNRQADLACKLVIKYRKQLSQQGIDIGDQENHRVFRMPLREVDRSRSISIADGKICIRFPYETQIIDQIKESGKSVSGNMRFDKIEKCWLASITEPRLLWLENLVDKYEFKMSDDVRALIDHVYQSKYERYKIELLDDGARLLIDNAQDSLVDYIDQNLSGFDRNNLIKLVDYSSILGYSVSAEIEKQLIERFSPVHRKLLLEREPHIPLSDDSVLSEIADYARSVGRIPVFVFENVGPDKQMTPLRMKLSELFGESAILDANDKKQKLDVGDYQCVYVTSWNFKWEVKIPLILTTTALMVGPKKKQIIQSSEKIVYCTDTRYDRKLLQ